MTPRRAAVTLAAALAALAMLAWLRADLAARLTAAGAPLHQRALAGSRPAVAALDAPAPLRVVILDGLARADAHGPALAALCDRGVDLVIDVGFPTKSLPVQSVLWTGRTAQETGVAMRNQLAAPLIDALPARLPGSIAVVEAWTSIATAMGFAVVQPAPDADRARADADPVAIAAWRTGFATAAQVAVRGPAPLVLVHVLAIDEAGHRGGREAAYRAAIGAADQLLATLVAAAPAARWLVLADHGHLAGGGHGDAERAVRLVRGCIAPRPAGVPARGAVHLIDVARHLYEARALSTPGLGRSLPDAIAAPDPDATLPRPSVWAWMVAGGVLAVGLAFALAHGRPRAAAAWPLFAAAAYGLLAGLPTLSTRSPTVAMLCGLTCAALILVPRGRAHPRRVTALVAPGVAVAAALAVVTGIPAAVLGGPPARLPWLTALLEVAASAAAPAVVVGAAVLGWCGSGRAVRAPDVRIPDAERPPTGHVG